MEDVEDDDTLVLRVSCLVHTGRVLVENLRLVQILLLLLLLLPEVRETGEVVQGGVGAVGVAVEGRGVAGSEQEDGLELRLSAQPEGDVHRPSLVDEGEVEGQGQVEDQAGHEAAGGRPECL